MNATGDDVSTADALPGRRASRSSILYAMLAEAAEKLHPAYFALVMASGIVSLACDQQGLHLVSRSLFYLNICFYAALWVLTLWRIMRFWRSFAADFSTHSLAPGFFTIVAATGVLGSQALLIGGSPDAAMCLWLTASVLWLGLTYAIFTTLIIKENKPSIAEGLNAGWLVAVVAAQSVSTLGSLIADNLGAFRESMLVFSLCAWLSGGMLYIWIISLIFYRYLFFRFLPQDLNPPYWINMGAVAITTLAGATLLAESGGVELLTRIRPFVEGFTFFFWATATWWIPMLVILGVWRTFYKKVRFQYSPLYWGVVFPLGMYGASTYLLGTVSSLPQLLIIPRIFTLIALTSWAINFLGMIRRFAVLARIHTVRSALGGV